MKKTLLFAALFLGSTSLFAQHEGHNHAQEAKTVVADPKATTPVASADTKKQVETLVVKQEVHDFGKIPQGKPVTTVFEVSNSGKEPLKIANVQASCGCTTPEWDKENPIPAGGNSKITVGYNAVAEGPFTKIVTITYNENLTKVITIKGEVWKTPATSAPENKGLQDLKN